MMWLIDGCYLIPTHPSYGTVDWSLKAEKFYSNIQTAKKKVKTS